MEALFGNFEGFYGEYGEKFLPAIVASLICAIFVFAWSRGREAAAMPRAASVTPRWRRAPRPRGVLPLALLALASCPPGVNAATSKRKKGDENKVSLPHHSFTSGDRTAVGAGSLLEDWMVTGASLATNERFLMHPGVPERMGFMWNKLPLLTNDFEVIFHFRIAGPKEPEKAPLDQALCFWYTKENVSDAISESKLIKASSWSEGMREQGLNFCGSLAKVQGFAAVLSTADAAKRPKASVSFVDSGAGPREFAFGTDAPNAAAKAIDFRNTLNAAMMKVRVTPTSIEGHVKQTPSLSWQECFKIDRTDRPVEAGGYMGFSAWSGKPPDGGASDHVSITKVEVNNFDENSIGEEMKDVSLKIQEAYRAMLTDENRHFLDQKSQTEHLQRLITMLNEHVETVKPIEQKMFADIEGLEQRISKLDEDVKTVIKAMNVVITPGADSGIGAMKEDIIGLRRLLVKDSASHRQKIDMVQKNIAEVKQRASGSSEDALFSISKQSEKLEKTVRSRSSQMYWLLLALVVSVLSIGALMWNRMRYYEKKHFI